MKISIIFDTVQEGLAALATLTGTTATVTIDDDTGEVLTPAVDPRFGVPLDATGAPWIEEVHAGTKGKNADGTWKRKKGVSEEQKIAAEKAAIAKLNATPAVPTVAPVTQAAPDPAVFLPPGAADVPPVSYEALTQKYAELAAAGLVDAQRMIAVYAQKQIDPSQLSTNETMRRTMLNALIQIEQAAAMPAGMPGLPGA